jgi:predicted ATPase
LPNFPRSKPLRLGSRALDILVTLVERAGETIRKDELITRTWPDTVVDEGALRVHVAALRKALGDGRAGKRYIANIPGRGYSFLAPVAHEPGKEATTLPNRAVVGGNLPASLTRIVGRSEIIACLATQLPQRRFVTIVGPGGIGKTTVAITVAETVNASYRDSIWFVGLASLADPELVPRALGAMLGISLPVIDPVSGLTAWLRDKHALIVLDSCEHIIVAAATLAEAVLKTAPRVHILATSREPLRAEGEWLHRLASLELPPASGNLSPEEALHYSAVQLFIERATASLDGLTFSAADVPAVLEICRRLDGVPLALELAADQIDVFGIRGLAARLDDRFAVLTKGRRTALPRHQTLRATLDWSYDLLPQTEQVILRRLALFQGDFTMDSAAAVVTDDRITTADAFEGVANLAMRSLVATDISRDVTYHRLLDTTRAYALNKLTESGEAGRISRLHAEYYCDLFNRAQDDWKTRPTAEWLADFERQTDDVRVALDWAFSAVGDASIGVTLTVAAVPLWTHSSLMEECRRRVEQALARQNLIAGRDPRHEMQLHAALGMSLNYTTGPVSKTAAAWTNTLIIAKSLGDTEYQLRALRGLWAHHMNGGEYRRALAFAHEFRGLAATLADPASLDFGDRMAAIILHYLGDQKRALGHLEHPLARPVAPVRHSQTARFLLDRDVTVQALLSRILWLQGFSDQAARTARLAVDRALAIGHALSLCHALAQAMCPVALYTGDLACAEGSVAMLLDNARERGLAGWIARGHCFLGMVMITREDFAAGLPVLRDALAELRESGAAPSYPAFLAILAGGLGRAGRVTEGLATIDQALMLSTSREEHWCLPELLRTKGELRLLEGLSEASPSAEDCFRQALDRAHRDGVLAWELRAASSLARLWQDQGRIREARDLLAPVYGRSSEGLETVDLREAKSLLGQLALAD